MLLEFSDILNEYIDIAVCSNKELSEVSGVSAETIGRYRKGLRKPQKDVLLKLSAGLSRLFNDKGQDISEKEIISRFQQSLNDGINVDDNIYISNLNKLVDCMDISKSDLAKNLNFDPSYISRVLSGKRKPSQIKKFNTDFSVLAAKKLIGMNKKKELSEIIGCSAEKLKNHEITAKEIYKWLGDNENIIPEYGMDKFLSKLDEFDLDKYIKAIKFDKMKLPSSSFQFPSSKKGSGLEMMMELEIDFIKATLLSKSKEDIIIYSDMPMEEMAKDKDFPKKWMFGTAMMLKKGLHMYMIHDVNRPFEEMMLGLESYIPMYMTGQISPYYLKSRQSEVFHHMIKVSGAAALAGEAIESYFKDGRYYFTNNKSELKYYRKRAEHLLSKASPLMNIYTEREKNDFESFFKDSFKLTGQRKMIFSNLPVFTLSDKLFTKISEREKIKNSEYEKLKSFIKMYRSQMENLLEKEEVVVEIPVVTKNEFENQPLKLPFPEIFYGRLLSYSYEEYSEHIEETRQFFMSFPNCKLQSADNKGFRNINISILSGKMVIVSKNISPAIHFVIHHPRMTEAFENFIFPITD